MELKKNESGYTFASLLLTLTIIIVTMPVIILLLQMVQLEADDSHIDAHQFFYFLYTDTLIAKGVDVNESEDILYFRLEAKNRQDGEVKATIEQYEDVIRRRVQGQGHEIYLRNIDTFRVTPVSYGFQVKLVMENGETYEKTIEHTTRRE